MLNFLIFIFFFYVCLISVIGYGFIFKKIFLSKLKIEEELNIYIGFYGLTLITLFSLFSSFFVQHNFYQILFCIL